METINSGKTFFIDIDGTIVTMLTWEELKIFSFQPNYIQELLPGVKEFFDNNKHNTIIFTTGRSEYAREMTERTLKFHNIQYKHLIMDLPIGERYLINDTPNLLFQKSIGINVLRNTGFGNACIFDPSS
jgi:hypothetical protein